MRVGAMIGDRPKTMNIASIVSDAQNLEERGLAHAWLPQVFGLDALGVFTVVGRETSTIELGTDVVPMQPRHPVVMAQQAATAQEASGGRFTLGIGLSHKMVIEGMFGLSYDHPAQFTREYLSILMPLSKGKPASFRGEFFTANAQLQFSDFQEFPVIVAALGPKMLEVAGRLADGTTTWMTGPTTLANHIIPSITKAAQDANRPAPRIIAGLPTVVTDDEDTADQAVDKFFRMYPALPSYKAMMDREGVTKPSELAVTGTEDAVRARITELFDQGVTDYVAAIAAPDIAHRDRTLDLLSDLARH